MVGLLLTRPRLASERFAAGLPDHISRRVRIVFSPLIDIRPRSEEIQDNNCAGLVFSSSNGVASAAQLLQSREIPAYCIGNATTATAQDAGWSAQCAGSNADELIEQLIDIHPPAPLLYLRGAHSRGEIAARLSAGGVACTERIIYDQSLLPFSQEALGLFSGYDPVIAPVFSPRTARQFAKHCPKVANLYLVALSEAVAEPLKSLNFKRLSICPKPNAEAMMHEVVQVGELVL